MANTHVMKVVTRGAENHQRQRLGLQRCWDSLLGCYVVQVLLGEAMGFIKGPFKCSVSNPLVTLVELE